MTYEQHFPLKTPRVHITRSPGPHQSRPATGRPAREPRALSVSSAQPGPPGLTEEDVGEPLGCRPAAGGIRWLLGLRMEQSRLCPWLRTRGHGGRRASSRGTYGGRWPPGERFPKTAASGTRYSGGDSGCATRRGTPRIVLSRRHRLGMDVGSLSPPWETPAPAVLLAVPQAGASRPCSLCFPSTPPAPRPHRTFQKEAESAREKAHPEGLAAQWRRGSPEQQRPKPRHVAAAGGAGQRAPHIPGAQGGCDSKC